MYTHCPALNDAPGHGRQSPWRTGGAAPSSGARRPRWSPFPARAGAKPPAICPHWHTYSTNPKQSESIICPIQVWRKKIDPSNKYTSQMQHRKIREKNGQYSMGKCHLPLTTGPALTVEISILCPSISRKTNKKIHRAKAKVQTCRLTKPFALFWREITLW